MSTSTNYCIISPSSSSGSCSKMSSGSSSRLNPKGVFTEVPLEAHLRVLMVLSLGVPSKVLRGVRPSIYSGICLEASLFEEFLLGFLLGAVLRRILAQDFRVFGNEFRWKFLEKSSRKLPWEFPDHFLESWTNF